VTQRHKVTFCDYLISWMFKPAEKNYVAVQDRPGWRPDQGKRDMTTTLLGRGRRLCMTGLLAVLAALPLGAWAQDEGSGIPSPEGGSRVVSVSAGARHSCGLKADGSVACWGENGNGQRAAPAGPFVSVSAGAFHNCGVKSDGSVDCWGSNQFGQAADQPGPFVSVSAGGYHNCGLKADGSVHCWGSNVNGQAADQPGPFVSVSAGNYHSCGVKADGSVDCWGGGGLDYGQAADQAGPFVSVSAGNLHTCGVKVDGSVDCWGLNGNGQAEDQAGPFVSVSAAEFHTCGVKADGSADCWGDNGNGQAADQTGPFVSVSAADFHTCGVKADGSVTCWGAGGAGTRNYPHFGQSTVPAGMNTAGSAGIGQLAAGNAHACQVKPDGAIACWGDNTDGQTTAPVGTFASVVAGDRHSCALSADGTVTCWGRNGAWNTTTLASSQWRQLAPGPNGAICALPANGGLAVCIRGAGGSGTQYSVFQFRNITHGVNTDQGSAAICGVSLFASASGYCMVGFDAAHANALFAGPWQRLESGLNHQCGQKADGSIECWGDNAQSQTTNVPTGSVRTFSVGWNHACAIKGDGTLACWGSNLNGQAMPPSGTFVQVSAGNTFTCAIRSNGTRVCWGSDVAGQAPQLALSPVLLPAGVVGSAYTTTQFSVTDAGNGADGDYVPPTPAFAVVAGALPAGLSLSAGGALTGTPTAVGDYAFTVEAEDGNGFTASQSYSITIADPTPPVISYILTPAMPANGWYTSTAPVGIDWAVSDPESAYTITSGCLDNPAALTSDTSPAGIVHSCSASSAGGPAGPVNVTLKRDATAPTITVAAATAANPAGWYKADVSVLVNCGDATPGSGIASCPSLANVTTDGTTTIPAQQATDNAGNASVASAPLTIKLDKTAPTLAPTVPSPLLRGGSYSATPNASDATSGIATSSCGALDTSSTGSKSTTCSATDNAGNSKTVTLNYTVTTTCSNDGYTGTQLIWCRNICEMGYTGATLDIWIHRWINRYRALPYCRVGAP
jgi:alpha-tubulin suppressor-like RCC1 family protein